MCNYEKSVIEFAAVDTDKVPEIANLFNVTTVPCVCFTNTFKIS